MTDTTLITCIKKNDVEKLNEEIACNIYTSDELDDALIEAAQRGRRECLEILLLHGNPLVDECLALRVAVLNNHKTCVNLLIPVSDPSGLCVAASIASEDKNQELFNVLYPYNEDLLKSNNLWHIKRSVAGYEQMLMERSINTNTNIHSRLHKKM